MGSVLKDTALGVGVLAGRVFRMPGPSVLLYHSIDESGSYMSTSPQMFRVQMEWLHEHGFRALSMRQLVERRREHLPPERHVVLTFDDGLANFAETAWPVLREMSFSATAYVPTDFIGGHAAWYADYGLPRLLCMTWDALRGTQREGADIQSHACSHRDLTGLGAAELSDEMRRSKEVLEDGLGNRVEHLAYPFGASTPAVQDAAREAGYRSGVVVGHGRWRTNTNPYKIPREGLDRITIRSPRTARLSIEACARGTFGWYTAPKAWIRSVYVLPPHLERGQG